MFRAVLMFHGSVLLLHGRLQLIRVFLEIVRLGQLRPVLGLVLVLIIYLKGRIKLIIVILQVFSGILEIQQQQKYYNFVTVSIFYKF